MADIKAPEFIQDINVFVNGIGHLGVSDEFELPKIQFNRETQNAGGFEIDVKNGTFQKLEAKFVLKQYSKNVIEAMSKSEDAYFVVKGSIFSDGKAVPAVVTIKGDFDLDLGNWKAKEQVKKTIEVKVKYFELEVNGKQFVQLDTKNMIAKINGKDLLAELRSNIA
jgi:uncharacterized protein